MNSPNFKTELGTPRTPACGQTSPPPPHILHIILQIIIPQTSLFTDNSFEIHFETEPDTAADVFHNHFHYQYSP